MKISKTLLVAAIGAAVCAGPVSAVSGNVTIDDLKVFPESLGSTPDGTLYIGGSTGRIYRAKPGSKYAEPWITKEQSGLHDGVRGVLADKASNTLWVCDNEGKAAWVVRFALDSGRKRNSYEFPGGGHCNDISLKAGAAYVTDTANGRILKLAPGADELTEWYSDVSDRSLDGLVWAKDGKLYADTYSTHHLIRIDVNGDGSAGKGTALKTSLPLYQPDGMRLTADGRILLVEGQGRPGAGLKEGRLDEVVLDGDSATIKVIGSGFELPTAVTSVGHIAWVLESKFDYLRNPSVKGQDPGSFRVYAVPLGRAKTGR